jgi:hypothetical protein
VPWNKGFDWKYVNYAPLTVIAVLIFTGLWWVIDARKRFTGPIREVDEPVAEAFAAGAEPTVAGA